MRHALRLFGRNFLGSVTVLLASLATFYFVGFHLPPVSHCVGIIISLSVLFAVLLTADSRTRSTAPPTTFWGGVVDLVANRQPLVLFLLIAASLAAAGTYYIF